MVKIWPELAEIDQNIQSQLSADALYAAYVKRQNSSVEALKRDRAHKIPVDFIYGELPGLSNELCNKLEKVKPETLDQANRIEGMTPSALMIILSYIRIQELKNVSS